MRYSIVDMTGKTLEYADSLEEVKEILLLPEYKDILNEVFISGYSKKDKRPYFSLPEDILKTGGDAS